MLTLVHQALTVTLIPDKFTVGLTALGVKPIVKRVCLPRRNKARHTSHEGNQPHAQHK
jgi:hypothetical protein